MVFRMKTKLVTIAGTILIGLFFFQCKEPVKEKVDFIKSWQFSFEDSIPGVYIVKDGAAEGKSFTRTNNQFNFSAGLVFPLPDSLIGKDLRVNVDCFIRKGESNARHALVVSFQNPDTTIFWNTFEADSVTNEKDKWVRLVDSTQISAQLNNKKGVELRVFGWNATGTSYFDIDGLKITLKKVQTSR